MNKIKRWLLIGLSVCAATCACAAITACAADADYPDFKRSQSDGTFNPLGDVFTIRVSSESGQPVMGATVSIVNGDISYSGVSSSDGEIKLNAPAGSYTVNVEEELLPPGYSIKEGFSGFRTSANATEANVQLTSGIITGQVAGSGRRYAMGDVLYDFEFINAEDGETYSISQLFEEGYNAVMFNWWFVNCGPCLSEFPVMHSAYTEQYQDKMAIICFSTRDSISTVRDFRSQYGYNFFMTTDASANSPSTNFGVSSTPTTVIVDRYGVICESHIGSIVTESTWSSIYERYTRDDYSQTIASGGSGNEGDVEMEWTRPPESIKPDYDEITEFMNAMNEDVAGKWYPETNEDEVDLVWPFIPQTDPATGEDYLTASNVNVPISYAIIYFDITLQGGDSLYLDYRLANLDPSFDTFYLIINGESRPALNVSGTTNGEWVTALIYDTPRKTTLNIGFCYITRTNSTTKNDEVSFKNLHIENAASRNVDYPYDAAGNIVDGNYTEYANVRMNLTDNFYHVYSGENNETDVGILFAKIETRTAWSEKIFGHENIELAGNRNMVPSLYNIAYWNMSNWRDIQGTDRQLVINLGTTTNHTQTIVDSHYLELYGSETGYVPVTQAVRDMLDAFVRHYHDLYNTLGDYSENEWLEFCNYFRHHGTQDHEADDPECLSHYNPIMGQNWDYALTAHEGVGANGTRIELSRVNDNRSIYLYYTFTPTSSGVYSIYASNVELISPDSSDENTPSSPAAAADISLTLYGGVSSGRSGDWRRYPTPGAVYETLVYLNAGQTVRIRTEAAVRSRFTLNILNTGEQSMDVYAVATTGDGIWSAGDSGVSDAFYVAINAVLNTDDNIYYQERNGRYGSKIYIDFTTPYYYFYQDGNRLFRAIVEGQFNLVDYGDENYTAKMTEFYEQSVAGKTPDDDDYGLLEANAELVSILAKYIEARTGENAINTNYWLSFACYIIHVGL